MKGKVMTEKTFSSLSIEMIERIQRITGREIPPLRSVHGLAHLPPAVLEDAEVINRVSGSILAFSYLFHVTDASFEDVKLYLSSRGWSESVD
jgi:hypothetical protein